MKPKISINSKETRISKVVTDNTGGNIYNDVIVLKDGIIIRISEGVISVFANADEDEDNNPIGTILLP
jgi:hypothetical protein